MNCLKHNNDSLQYVSPAHGGWGQVRMCMLVPESHQLFICPSACGRHGALGAVLNHQKDRLSYLYITESDIIDGYDDKIVEAVDTLLKLLNERTKVLFVFVSCLDDLIGTDLEAIIEELNEKYDDVKIVSCHMNPIQLEGKKPPTLVNYDKMFSVLDKSSNRDETSVNLLGNFVALHKESEVFDVLKHAGVRLVNQISDFKTFEEYQRFADSSLNIVISPIAKKAAISMQKRLDIDFIKCLVSYDINTIIEGYISIQDKLKVEPENRINLEGYISKTQIAIDRVKKKIDTCGIAVDESAVKKPFELSYALLSKGFNVRVIFANNFIDDDKVFYEKILSEFGHVKVYNHLHVDSLCERYNAPEYIAIGFEAAHLTKSNHIVNLFNDEQMFGFHGIVRLMDLMEKAYDEQTNLNDLLDEYGLVV